MIGTLWSPRTVLLKNSWCSVRVDECYTLYTLLKGYASRKFQVTLDKCKSSNMCKLTRVYKRIKLLVSAKPSHISGRCQESMWVSYVPAHVCQYFSGTAVVTEAKNKMLAHCYQKKRKTFFFYYFVLMKWNTEGEFIISFIFLFNFFVSHVINWWHKHYRIIRFSYIFIYIEFGPVVIFRYP